MVCGLAMTVFQAWLVGLLAGKISEMVQVGVGFALMGLGITLLATAQTKFFVFAFVALLALGMAFIAPNLSALVSRRDGEGQGGFAWNSKRGKQRRASCGASSGRAVSFKWRIAHRARFEYRLEICDKA